MINDDDIIKRAIELDPVAWKSVDANDPKYLLNAMIERRDQSLRTARRQLEREMQPAALERRIAALEARVLVLERLGRPGTRTQPSEA